MGETGGVAICEYLLSMRVRAWGCVVACLLLVACGEDAPADPVEEAAATETPEANPADDIPEASPARDLMRGHFGRAVDARQSMVRGDLERARADMGWLATHERGGDLAEELRPQLAQMQTEAARFAEAQTLTEAGTALARTLTRCGSCHRSAEAGPEIGTPALPDGDDVRSHMQRHRWAEERMWAGLITSSEEAYEAGAGVLREAALHEGELPGHDTQPDGRLEPITGLVHQLGADAQAAEDWDERANIYGRLLATCAACHRLLDAGPAGTVAQPQGEEPAD